MRCSISISVFSNPGDKRVNIGDVITVHPKTDPGSGGKMTRKICLFIPVDFGASADTWQEGRFLQARLLNSAELASDALGERLQKRRYSVDIDALKRLVADRGVDVDWKRVFDVEDDYQPLLDGRVFFDVDDLITNKASGLKLKKADITMICTEVASGIVS